MNILFLENHAVSAKQIRREFLRGYSVAVAARAAGRVRVSTPLEPRAAYCWGLKLSHPLLTCAH